MTIEKFVIIKLIKKKYKIYLIILKYVHLIFIGWWGFYSPPNTEIILYSLWKNLQVSTTNSSTCLVLDISFFSDFLFYFLNNYDKPVVYSFLFRAIFCCQNVYLVFKIAIINFYGRTLVVLCCQSECDLLGPVFFFIIAN